ncbi:MAG: bifunctional diguanylate cyclase/phosphodiesterase, partial [Rhodoferax sp.]|nr:bifunctional diguanylate cyclase/phosphodiesterase [Rhodoferax sp.]
MDTWQFISLGVAAALSYLYWLERKKRLQATSDRDRALNQMSAKNSHDERTGLLSQDAFDKALDQATQNADRSGGSYCVLSIVLDNFGLIQDGFDEETSSQVLVLTAQRLLSSAGSEASVCKCEGGEFAVLVSGGIPVGTQLADRIRAELSKPIALATNTTQSTCSIGIATYPDHGARAKMWGNAALAMRSLKSSGGDDYCVYDPKMAVQARDEAVMVNDLRQAVAANQFTLYFQPKIDAQSLQVTAAEALLRWHHPVRGFVSPVVFIPLAEKYGLMGPIGNWVIEEASRTAAVWLESGLRMRVAVNISGYQMRQDNLVEHIVSVLERHGVQPERFTCEITETVAMEDTAATKLTFEKMRQAGFHVSIDDFGTGYSSLGSLRRLPAAELKIDRAFVMDLEESEEARSIAKSIIDMARALGLKVIAEGVETVGQSNLLVDMGCDELQGFLYSMPIAADELQKMAMNRHAGDGSDFRDSLFA